MSQVKILFRYILLLFSSYYVASLPIGSFHSNSELHPLLVIDVFAFCSWGVTDYFDTAIAVSWKDAYFRVIRIRRVTEHKGQCKLVLSLLTVGIFCFWCLRWSKQRNSFISGVISLAQYYLSYTVFKEAAKWCLGRNTQYDLACISEEPGSQITYKKVSFSFVLLNYKCIHVWREKRNASLLCRKVDCLAH